jgi:hypothetical protein
MILPTYPMTRTSSREPTVADDNEPCTDCPDFAAVTATDENEPDTGADPRGTKVTRWGPVMLAPIGKPTGDKRRFAAGALSHRDRPLGLKWQRQDGQGHSGSVVVGTLDGITYDDEGAPWGFGLLFNPDPEQLPRLAEDAREARLLIEQGVIGPSVDLDDMEFHALGDPEQYAATGERPEIEVTKGRISAATLVPIPAFAEAGAKIPLMDMEPGDYSSELEAHKVALTPAVRASGWDDLAVAPLDTPWDAPGAARRISEWAGERTDLLAQGYLWVDGQDDLFRFPLADVIDGQLTLVPQALTAAAQVLAGQTVLPEPDQARMREVVADLREYVTDREISAALAALDDETYQQVSGLAEELTGEAPGTATFGARFEKLKAALGAKGIDNPAALAAKIGRKKYGKQGMARLRQGVAAKKVKPLHGAVTAAVDMEAIVAAATPEEPQALPAAWFADPKLDGPTPLTVTPDGRVFGHLATWGTCHTGMPNVCTTPPKSKRQYAYFHTGAVDTTEGEIAVGRISIGGGHADTRMGFQAAAEHYDSTSAQAAVVRAGEDKHGIWLAGAAVPGADLAELKRSPLSGDWRRIGGNLELVHALAVNSGGFPVPRASMVAGAQLALVAAGTLQVEQDGAPPVFSAADLEALVVQTVRATREAERAEERGSRVLAALSVMDDAMGVGQAATRRKRAAQAASVIAGPVKTPVRKGKG